VIAYRDVEDALERANGTMFGLGASVWSADPDRAAAVAEQVDAGMTWINTHTAIAFDQPFAGAKWSGIGVEAGELGLDAYTDVRVLHRVK
jgi:acyl-CoA reductase-like NAD-dependent aldehyde dehydrogenase